MERRYLYECYTEVTGSIYVVAPDPTTARDEIQKRLNDADYGFAKDRVVTDISLKAVEQRKYFDDKEREFSFTEDRELIIIL